ncbi:MAG TPA: triose-phosphate isomerase, partial [Coxiellaceae bacterium]|nr:triose-phosphate isomerase [Coxiellaceae bacterium]
MRIPIIAGNWKMNKTIGETLDFLKILSQELQQSSATTKFEIVIAPSFIAINKMAELLKDSPVKICA